MEIQRFRLLEARAQVKRERNTEQQPDFHSGSGSAKDLPRIKTEKQDCELLPERIRVKLVGTIIFCMHACVSLRTCVYESENPMQTLLNAMN